MANNKKSFVLYCDVIHTVEQLTDEQAGDLFKHILRYVNDQNPTTDNTITRIAFEPIKQALKRDLQKYESIRERNTNNANMRWHATACDRIPNDAKNAVIVSDSVSVSDSVIKKEKQVKEKTGRFTPPDILQVQEYMKQIGMDDIAEKWHSYYQSNGWKVGRNAMKDWKAAVRSWRTKEANTINRPKLATL